MKKLITISLIAGTLLLAACGNTTNDKIKEDINAMSGTIAKFKEELKKEYKQLVIDIYNQEQENKAKLMKEAGLKYKQISYEDMYNKCKKEYIRIGLDKKKDLKEIQESIKSAFTLDSLGELIYYINQRGYFDEPELTGVSKECVDISNKLRNRLRNIVSQLDLSFDF